MPYAVVTELYHNLWPRASGSDRFTAITLHQVLRRIFTMGLS